MTSIRQHIPSFIQGQTDQPDELKRPGQVSKMSNVFPDVTMQCVKRPGYKWLADLNGTIEGKWFNIFLENSQNIEEQYVANIDRDGNLKIWAAMDIISGAQILHTAGDEVDIVYKNEGSLETNYPRQNSFKANTPTLFSSTMPDNLREYFSHDEDSQLQTLSINNATFLTNRKIIPTMTGDTATNRPFEAFIDINSLNYNRQYAFNLATPDDANPVVTTTATSIEVYAEGQPGAATNCPGTFAAEVTFEDGPDKTDLKVYFDIQCQVIPRGTETQSRYINRGDLVFGGSGWVTGDRVVYNRVYQDGDQPVTHTVIVTGHSTQKVYANIAQIRPTPTPTNTEELISMGTILGDLQTEVDSVPGFTSQIIGNGLYITSDTEFVINTSENDLFNVLSYTTDTEDSTYSTINNATNLPNECKDGYIVKVANSIAEEDDYYLRFYGNNDADGTGIWEECAKPGIPVQINSSTMPHQIYRGFNSATERVEFEVSPIYWNKRGAGDDKTNPVPSFIRHGESQGGPINKLMLYRNRLVALSHENIVLSQAGDLFNYFGDTALTVASSDPIDVTASTDSSSVLYDGLVTNNGMIIFSAFNQFLFTTDSDLLGPRTAKSSLIASYDFNKNSNPFNIASNVGFFSSAGDNSIFYEMKDIYREGPPLTEERSKPVSRSINFGLDIVTTSREAGLVMASRKGLDKMWCYRYFYQRGDQLQDAWFTWSLPGEMVTTFSNTRGELWTVVDDGGTLRLLSFNLNQKLTAESIEGWPYNYYVYMDSWAEVTSPTYDSTTDTSNFALPFTPTEPLYAYTLDVGEYRGRFSTVLVTGSTGTLEGDWSETNIAVGYQYSMDIEFPRFYVTRSEGRFSRSDTSANLTLHRVQLNFGLVGIYDVELLRLGKDSYSMQFEATEMDYYGANRVGIYPEKSYMVPIYDKAENAIMTLKSSYPTPATLNSATFEGDYTDNYYQRV